MAVLSETFSLFRKNYVNLSVLFGLAVVTNFLFGPAMKYIIILGLLLVVASLSTFYYNYFHSPLNFELVKLSTVVATLAYGLLIGIAMGVAGTMLSRLLSSRLDQRTIVSVLGILLATAVAFFLQSFGILIAGMAAVLAYHAVNFPVSLASGDNWGFAAAYTLTNVFFNALIFARVAPAVLAAVS